MRADAQRNYDRLIAAAREAFNEHGVEASLDDIAKRAKVGPGTLYRHFRNREELLAAVYREDVEGLAARVDELVEKFPPEEAFAEYLRVQLAYITQMHGLGAALKTMLGTDSLPLQFCKTIMRDAVRRVLDPAQQAGIIRPDVEPPDVLRLVHGVGKVCETVPDQADRLLGFILDGLRPPAR